MSIWPQILEASQSQYRNPDRADFSIFGLAFNDADLQQFLSKLGPAILFNVESNPDLKCICFISSRDDTLVLLKFNGNHYAGFNLMSQKKQFYKWHFCEPSAQVSMSILIDNRLKLGQDRDQIKSILGTPQSETEEFLKYVYRWGEQSVTGGSQDNHRSDDAVQNNTTQPKTVTCIAEFSENKLISLKVSKHLE